MKSVKNKGLSTTQDGISQCSTGHNLYEVRSRPRTLSEQDHLKISKQLQIEKELILRFQKSKRSQRISRFMKYSFLCVFAPPYYVLFYFPRWIYYKKIYPVLARMAKKIKQIIAVINDLFSFFHHLIKKVQERIEKIKNVFKEFFFQVRSAIKKRVIEPIVKPFRPTIRRIVTAYRIIRSICSFIFNAPSTIRKYTWETHQKVIERVKSQNPITPYIKRVKEIPDQISEQLLNFKRYILLGKNSESKSYNQSDCYFPVDKEKKSRFPIINDAKVFMREMSKEMWKRMSKRMQKRISPYRIYYNGIKRGYNAIRSSVQLKIGRVSNYFQRRCADIKSLFNQVIEPISVKYQAKMQSISSHYQTAKTFSIEVYEAIKDQTKKRIVKPLLSKLEPYYSAPVNFVKIVTGGSLKVVQKVYYYGERKLTEWRDGIIESTRVPVAYVKVVPRHGVNLTREAFIEFKLSLSH